MAHPYTDLKVSIFDIPNIHVKPPINQPTGRIQVSWVSTHIEDNGDFFRLARSSSATILKTLSTRPLATKELLFKLNQDIDSEVLVSLKDFLNRPDVKDRDITKFNVHNYLMTMALILVTNPHNQSSKIRLCVDPSHKSKHAENSVNDTLGAGFPHILKIARSSKLRLYLYMGSKFGYTVL